MKNQKILFLKKIKNHQGSLLLISYFAIVVILGLGAALALMATHDLRIAERQRINTVSFYIAEAGLERAIYDLRKDFLNNTLPSWADGNINGYIIGPDDEDFYEIPYQDTSFNNGTYKVYLKNVLDKTDHIWIRSQGSFLDQTTTLQAYVEISNSSPWNTAIFAGSGAQGSLINGNVKIFGTVIALGDGLSPGDFVMDLGGTAELVGNNYSSLPSVLAAKVPLLPTTVFNGETVQTLNASLHVRRGIVGLSGNARVGQPNVPGNFVKETVDGVYVTDGWGGNQGASNVFSDNGTNNPFNLGDSLRLPSLSDPSPEDPSRTIQQYFKDNALILTNELVDIKPNSNFSYTDGTNSISMDGAGNMTIQGRVYVEGENGVNISGQGNQTTIQYTGAGTILSNGDVNIRVNLLTPGDNSFPSNIVGFMTPKDINFTTSQLDVMGLFYAENKIKSERQTTVLGTFVSNYFDMGNQVPSLFQVPETINHLPQGLIGGDSGWILQVVSWKVL